MQSEIKTTLCANKLIESQALSSEAGEIVIRANTAWLTLHSEIEASQKLVNALHGLSLIRGDQRTAKLDELKSRYEGTQIEGLLDRLFDC